MEPSNRKSVVADDAPLDERRVSPRRRVLKGATLTFNRGYGAMECVVRNLSDHGALLRFGDTAGVPSNFDLQIAGEVGVRSGHVCWRRETEVGIAFDSQVALA